MKKILININDEMRTVYVDPTETLLEVLRDKLGVTSPKCGCDRGDCGACAVLLNNRSVRSCLVLAIEVDGQEVKTLEGISKEGLSKVQEKMLIKNAFQCGFCAPGMIISATELLETNPNPCIEEIKEALSGNLCRCTGYTPILESIVEANAKCKE